MASNSLNKRCRVNLPLFIMEGPMLLWLTLFVIVPLFYVIQISVMTKNAAGGVTYALSIEGYKGLISASYLEIIWKSFKLAFYTTALCIIIGYPFAVVITKVPKKYSKLIMLLIMLPFWINSVIRIYGWHFILRNEGILNTLLINLGIIDAPLVMLYTDSAVLLGMVYELLPFMILPLYTSLEKLDYSLLEAASDLGAKKYRGFLRVTLPLTLPGVFAGCIQTFIPSLGLFYISEMMGGGKEMYIGNVIKNQFSYARNWPLGAALSILLIAITLILLKLYTKVGNLEDMA